MINLARCIPLFQIQKQAKLVSILRVLIVEIVQTFLEGLIYYEAFHIKIDSQINDIYSKSNFLYFIKTN